MYARATSLPIQALSAWRPTCQPDDPHRSGRFRHRDIRKWLSLLRMCLIDVPAGP